MLDAEQQNFNDLRERVEEAAAAADDRVELNVRGQKFATRKSNIMKNENTFFYNWTRVPKKHKWHDVVQCYISEIYELPNNFFNAVNYAKRSVIFYLLN